MDDWPRRPGYLDTAAYGLPHPQTAQALRSWTDAWESGAVPYTSWLEATDTARGLFAELLSVPAQRVCTGVSGSQLAGQLAGSLPDGRRVLAARDEFTSLLFPFLAQADRGVTVECVEVAELADAIRADTDVVLVSAVSPRDGRVAPLDAIAAAASAAGAVVVVDAAQAVGWLDRDWSGFDAVIVPAFKWLCAPRGVAFMTLSEGLLAAQRPSAAGWFASEGRAAAAGGPLRLAGDARRLDLSPVWSSWDATRAALEALLALGAGAAGAHDLRLANRVREGLGLARGASPIVIADGSDAASRLRAAGITATARPDHARLAFHIYNDSEDVDRVLEALNA